MPYMRYWWGVCEETSFFFFVSHIAVAITEPNNEINESLIVMLTFPFEAAALRSASLCAFDGRPLLGGIVAVFKRYGREGSVGDVW